MMPMIEIERGEQRFDTIDVSIIIDAITRNGGFVYAPRFWSPENDKLIKELLDSKLIKEDNGTFNCLNPSYSYIAN